MSTNREAHRIPDAVAAALCRAFNATHREYVRPLTREMLQKSRQDEIGKDGSFCYYSVFTRRNRYFLASYWGHRMTNEVYREFAEDESTVFTWESCGGMMFGGEYREKHLRKFRRARRRAARVGIKIESP